jgi:hypothetical protein
MEKKRMNSAQLLHNFLLIAVRDRADKLVFRLFDTSGCEWTAWILGEKLEIVPPEMKDFQAFPAELARLEVCGCQWWRSLNRWILRACWGLQSGRFSFPIGNAAVLVQYRAQWCNGRVAELEIIFGLAPGLSEAAQAKLLEMNPPHD